MPRMDSVRTACEQYLTVGRQLPRICTVKPLQSSAQPGFCLSGPELVRLSLARDAAFLFRRLCGPPGTDTLSAARQARPDSIGSSAMAAVTCAGVRRSRYPSGSLSTVETSQQSTDTEIRRRAASQQQWQSDMPLTDMLEFAIQASVPPKFAWAVAQVTPRKGQFHMRSSMRCHSSSLPLGRMFVLSDLSRRAASPEQPMR